MTHTIFAVDDNDTSLATIEQGLEDTYNVITIPSAERLFVMLGNIVPSLILLDISMPGQDGFQVLDKLKQSKAYRDIPVIFLTGNHEDAVEAEGLARGAVDFMHKPFSIPILRNRLKLHLNISHLIKERTKELEEAHHNLIVSMADLVEGRDLNTGGHVHRTTHYVRLLIQHMLAQGVYFEEIRGWDIEDIVTCSALHDVGKINISDTILNKPGRLTVEEMAVMKTHALGGSELIEKVLARTKNNRLLEHARIFAECHHENWDGSGYPHGLKGEDIPLLGRVMAIADVYDALVSERTYKSRLSPEAAAAIILEGAGSKFDPRIVKVFASIQDQFAAYSCTERTEP